MSVVRILIALTITSSLGSPATVNESGDLDSRLERLALDLESARKTHHVPGMSIAIVQDGEVIWTRGFGLADVDGERHADPETVFAVGSTTKAFTASLAGMLVDDGLVEWDDPVTRHLPYFDLKVRSDEAGASCTIRDLLSHRHGFVRMGILVMGGKASSDDILRTAAGAEPWDDHRAGFHYSNVAYLAAGEALARAAESSWEDLIQERIFVPLEMSSSTVSLSAAQDDPRVALGYSWDTERKRLDRDGPIDLGVIAPAGAIYSNAVDMAQWLRFQLGRGQVDGHRLLSPERHAETWEAQVGMGEDASYGLGWMLRKYRGRQVVEHGGNVDGFSAQVAMLPDEGLGYVLLMNLGAAPLREASMELVFDALVEESRATAVVPDDFSLEAHLGVYIANFARFRDAEFKVLDADGQLALEAPGQPRVVLHPTDEDGRWTAAEMGSAGVSFHYGPDGAAIAMVLHTGGFNFEVPREGMQDEPEVPAEELEGYVGTYIRAEGGKRVEVLIDRGRLTLEDKGNRMAFHTPDADGWASLRARGDQGATFVTDAEGTAESFVFHGNAGKKLFTRKLDEAGEDLPSMDEIVALREAHGYASSPEEDGATRVSGEVWVPQAGLRGEVTITTQGKDRYAHHLDFGKFGRISTVASGYRASTWSGLRGLEELEGRDRTQALLENPGAVDGDWSAYFDQMDVLRNETLNGRPVHVLRMRKHGMPSRTYWVDAETGDVLRTKYVRIQSGAQLPVTTDYSGFEELDGIRRAMRIELTNPVSGRTLLNLGTPERGLDLSPDTFVLREPGAKD